MLVCVELVGIDIVRINGRAAAPPRPLRAEDSPEPDHREVGVTELRAFHLLQAGVDGRQPLWLQLGRSLEGLSNPVDSDGADGEDSGYGGSC